MHSLLPTFSPLNNRNLFQKLLTPSYSPLFLLYSPSIPTSTNFNPNQNSLKDQTRNVKAHAAKHKLQSKERTYLNEFQTHQLPSNFARPRYSSLLNTSPLHFLKQNSVITGFRQITSFRFQISVDILAITRRREKQKYHQYQGSCIYEITGLNQIREDNHPIIYDAPFF